MSRKELASNTPDGVLVRLKDKLCIASGVDVHKLKILIDRHVMRTFNGVTNSKTHVDRINTYNELTKDKMTIKVFFKFLKMLDLESVKITVAVKTRTGIEYSVQEDINFMSNDLAEETKNDK